MTLLVSSVTNCSTGIYKKFLEDVLFESGQSSGKYHFSPSLYLLSFSRYCTGKEMAKLCPMLTVSAAP